MASRDLFSTRELARICGVSESTIKRWADEGLLACIRTPGGHRKFTLEALVAFAQDHHFALDSMGSLSDRERVAVSIGQLLRARSGESLQEALLAALRVGDRFTALHLLRRAAEGHYPLVRLIDEIITPTMTAIGRLWTQGELTIDEEHCASQIVLDAIGELRSLHPEAIGEVRTVIGACGPGETHVLGLKLLLTLLAQQGWRTIDLGGDLPFANLARLAEQKLPDLVLVSCSSIPDPDTYVREFNAMTQALHKRGITTAIGGSALTGTLRRRLRATWYLANAAQLLERVAPLDAGSGQTAAPGT